AAAPVVQRRYGVLAETVAQIGGPELRNVATVGGNVAGALPCADMPPVLMTLGARVKLSRAGGERWLPLEDFFPEFGRTAAADGELVSEIGVPPPPPRSAGVYLKFHDRHAMDMTVVGVGAFVTLERDGGAIKELRLALAGSAPTIFRARRAEALLRGQAPSEEAFDAALEAAAEAASREAAPRSSWRANREYRTVLIRSLTTRAIRRACEKAGRREGVAR
ncbi:MAG: FAD binding domain-containing protein, partial [Burkholderiales bacterium]|nr:FAD binding domain-containing protein [Burkholderiales bacterium]